MDPVTQLSGASVFTEEIGGKYSSDGRVSGTGGGGDESGADVVVAGARVVVVGGWVRTGTGGRYSSDGSVGFKARGTPVLVLMRMVVTADVVGVWVVVRSGADVVLVVFGGLVVTVSGTAVIMDFVGVFIVSEAC